jgi:hypothetical protein
VADTPREAVEVGGQAVVANGGVTPCECGRGDIVWKPYAPLPFPEVASDSQLERQRQGGRWVHLDEDEESEWCPTRRPYPADLVAECQRTLHLLRRDDAEDLVRRGWRP